MLKNAYLKLPIMASKKGGPTLIDAPRFTLLAAFDDFIEKFDKKTQKQLRSKETLRQWRSTRNKVAAFLPPNLSNCHAFIIRYFFGK